MFPATNEVVFDLAQSDVDGSTYCLKSGKLAIDARLNIGAKRTIGTNGEIIMSTFKSSATIALSFVGAIALCNSASAAKKMSYEDAFTKCKAEISANVPMSDTTTSSARYSAGSACMKKYGYRLKKGAM